MVWYRIAVFLYIKNNNVKYKISVRVKALSC